MKQIKDISSSIEEQEKNIKNYSTFDDDNLKELSVFLKKKELELAQMVNSSYSIVISPVHDSENDLKIIGLEYIVKTNQEEVLKGRSTDLYFEEYTTGDYIPSSVVFAMMRYMDSKDNVLYENSIKVYDLNSSVSINDNIDIFKSIVEDNIVSRVLDKEKQLFTDKNFSQMIRGIKMIGNKFNY